MSNLLNISSSPHVRDKSSTKSIMWDVFLALMPATIVGIYNFGYKAAILIVACVAAAVLTEYIWQKAMKLPVTVSDGSAALTGLLLALNLSSTFPVWMAILGSVFAIIIVKQLFGGLGQNFMNPALGAATAVADLLASGDGKTQVATSVLKMFIGTIGGTIGETSALALLIGAAYLLIKKVITWKIPVCYIGTFAVFALIFGGRGFDLTYLAAEICGGGLMLGAFFMATDYVTSPITPKGQIIFGVLLAILTGIFRIFGASAEGVSYAIIICNLLVPLIEKVTIPVPFGKEGIKDGK